MSLSRTRPRMTGEVHRTFIEWFSSSSYWQAKTETDPRITPAKVQESLITDVFEPPTSTGSLCSSFSTFSCLTNELPSSHFSIYDLIFSTKSELYRSKRRSFDFRLTSVAQKRLCLRWFPSFALRIPTAHDFCVISARKWARKHTKCKRFPSN